MISPQSNVLAQLRKTTLAYLSDADFLEIEKAVERDGILSLQGSVATIVKDAVRKHGTHDQSSHNPKKGGGMGGGGGGGATSNQSHMGEAITAAKEDIANRIKGAESQVGRTKPSSMRPQDSQTDSRIEGTVKGYKAAGALIGKPNELGKLKADMVRAKKDVLSPSYGIAGTDRAYVYGFADAVISVADAYGTLKND